MRIHELFIPGSIAVCVLVAACSKSAPTRLELVVEGHRFPAYLRNVADDRVAAASEFAGTRRRMK